MEAMSTTAFVVMTILTIILFIIVVMQGASIYKDNNSSNQ